MYRSRVLPPGRYDAPPPAKEPLFTRSFASALAVGAPLGLVIWLAWQEMPNVTWFLTRVLQHVGQ